ncbi:GTP-binding protein ERG [Macadamia integrifolia]|uniref:GTP-binding protein ERG n=1 Tax=Macadamia integrifolia TaxID=60698 RepID=UPI001C4FC4CB|nr:GTP-binding protein ERG [Macadamia integrifolia]
MKALRALRGISTLSTLTHRTHLSSIHFIRFYASEPQQDDPINTGEDSDDIPAFDSSDYALPTIDLDSEAKHPRQPIWNKEYRMRVDQKIFGIETQKESSKVVVQDEEGRRASLLAKALLHAALEKPDDVEEEDMVVKEEDQKSLSVGIIGAPNAGKSALTNFMVGTKVSAVSRKTNTTIHEVLGVMTKGNTQICFFDTPGLMLKSSGHPFKTDVKVRVVSAWTSVDLYDVLIVIFDVHRHLSKPDKRVLKLIKHLGAQAHPKQKRVLCMNKVDLVEVKKDLLKVAEEFGDLPGYERYFMISGLKGSGVKNLTQYLMDQAVKRPWDEEPSTLSEDVMKNISLEVVREKMLHHIHQEIPYIMDHRLMDWKELRDGSLRIEQHFITQKQSQRKILVGKNGSKIGRIGVEANEELRSIFKRHVHLILQVRVA